MKIRIVRGGEYQVVKITQRELDDLYRMRRQEQKGENTRHY